jgi:tight adherence protein B
VTGSVLLVLSIALLFAGFAILLWHGASVGARQRASAAHLSGRLQFGAPRMDLPVASLPAGTQASRSPHDATWSRVLLRAGVGSSSKFHLWLLLPGVILVLLAGTLLGLLPGLLVAGMYAISAWFWLWLRIQKRSRAMSRQLPGLLDQVVRMVTIGNSTSAAFQESVSGVDQPLREVLERALARARAGADLDHALHQMAQLYAVPELELVAAVVRVSQRYGGRADVVLERMAGFMRDREQAQQELVAMSAETRLSAWILGLLPVLLAGYIVTFNSSLFLGMWHDPLGRKLLFVAVALEAIGAWLLYRLAKSL